MVKLNGIILLGVLVFCSSCQMKEEQIPRFQNVVVIVSDDHTPGVTGCYGNALVRTPNIDRIALAGVRFTNAYANAPICSASRQSLLTGKYPHATGVNLLFTPFNDEMNLTVAEHLGEQGFVTGVIGKTHWNDWIYYSYWEQWPDFGFDSIIGGADWKKDLLLNPPDQLPGDIPTRANTTHDNDIAWQKNAQMLPAPYRDKDSDGTFFARRAIDFIKSNAEERFFLWVAFHEPHAPFNFPVEFAGRHKPEDMPLPEGGAEDQRWVPEIFRDLTEAERRGIIASYYTSVEYMDKNVGLILDELEASGLDENTLVVYLGDQGYLLNDHGRFEKHTMWAESIKSPLVIKGNGLSAGLTVDQVVEFVDLAPTLYEALGVGSNSEVQGKSMMPLLTGQTGLHKEYVFSEYLEDNMAMVASRKWKYVFTTGKRDLGLGYATGYGPSGLTHMLYDLENDPRETTNLAYKEAYQDTMKELQKIMLDRFMATHPSSEFVPGELNITGKLIWFCEPGDVGEEPGSELQRIFEKRPVNP